MGKKNFLLHIILHPINCHTASKYGERPTQKRPAVDLVVLELFFTTTKLGNTVSIWYTHLGVEDISVDRLVVVVLVAIFVEVEKGIL